MIEAGSHKPASTDRRYCRIDFRLVTTWPRPPLLAQNIAVTLQPANFSSARPPLHFQRLPFSDFDVQFQHGQSIFQNSSQHDSHIRASKTFHIATGRARMSSNHNLDLCK